jgi:hypothetical protein
MVTVGVVVGVLVLLAIVSVFVPASTGCRLGCPDPNRARLQLPLASSYCCMKEIAGMEACYGRAVLFKSCQKARWQTG